MVRPRPAMLWTADEVDAYFARFKSDIMGQIEIGKPVIVYV